MIDFSKIDELSNIQINIFTIKTFFIILYTYFTNFNLVNEKTKFTFVSFLVFIGIIFISNLSGIIKFEMSYPISMMFSILMTSYLFSKTNKKLIKNNLIVTTISFCINNVLFMISAAIIFIISTPIGICINQYINLIAILIIYTILLISLFKIRKLKGGLKFLQENSQNENIDIVLLNVCITVLFFHIIFSNYIVTVSNSILMVFGASIILMFITIQKSLQLYYKQKILVQELDKVKDELENKNKEIENLEAENIAISKKAHTLDHKQKSLAKKIDEMMLNTEISKEEVAEVKERLNKIGQDLYKEKTAVELSKTEIPEIDDMLRYMQSECSANKIDFELQIKGNIHYMTNNLITKEDLETLLADHIKNAIIAINHTDNVNKSILVRLGEIDGIYSLYIYDSGIEFSKETLENLGKKPSTTHADEGGTGMGFMNTFDTLRKCKASLTIEEFNEPRKDNYTKAIIIKFDNKNEFKIKSYREFANSTL